MIFVTVGAQMPFERLIRSVDAWVKTKDNLEVFAQIGDSSYTPEYIEWVSHIEPNEYRECIKKSDLVVAHAGMGTILSVLELGKPLIIMPRHGSLGETRNDHQLATAKHFRNHKNILLANDENKLQEKLEHWKNKESLETIGPYASDELLLQISSYLESIKT